MRNFHQFVTTLGKSAELKVSGWTEDEWTRHYISEPAPSPSPPPTKPPFCYSKIHPLDQWEHEL